MATKSSDKQMVARYIGNMSDVKIGGMTGGKDFSHALDSRYYSVVARASLFGFVH